MGDWLSGPRYSVHGWPIPCVWRMLDVQWDWFSETDSYRVISSSHSIESVRWLLVDGAVALFILASTALVCEHFRRQWKGRFQFRLATLLWLVTVAASLLGLTLKGPEPFVETTARSVDRGALVDQHSVTLWNRLRGVCGSQDRSLGSRKGRCAGIANAHDAVRQRGRGALSWGEGDRAPTPEVAAFRLEKIPTRTHLTRKTLFPTIFVAFERMR